MKYNFIETDDIKKTILELNGVSEERLNKEYDFTIKDEVFLNFKDKLCEYKDLRFLIVGDFDADGICSTTIISKLLKHLNIESNYYIPSRIKDGYGLNESIVETANKYHFDVLLLVDNGIVCNEQIELAHSYGIKVMIIDHHEYDTLPDAEAIIHSKIVSNDYINLSAGGLCYLLSSLFYDDDLSLVLGGISTISDVMSVLDFNRSLIKKAYSKLQEGNITSINLLNDNKEITYDSISYTIIPKINAISRMEPMGNPNHLVKFFLEEDISKAKEYIEKINYINNERKIYSNKMIDEANRSITNKPIEVIAFNSVYEGLCGLVANRLLYSLRRPTVIISLKEGIYKGSARSPEGFNIFEQLKDFDGYLSYGGHENAVGLSFKEESLTFFKEYISNIDYSEKEETIDGILLDTDKIDFNLIKDIESLMPYGNGFKEPTLVIENRNYKKIVISGKYPKFLINNSLSAISFNESLKDEIPAFFIGRLSKDSYRANCISFTIEEMI